LITKVKFEKFTAFENLKVDCSPGINIFIGKNGTGKTHVLKVLYTAISALNENKRVSDKLVDVFLPKDKNIGRLVKRKKGSSEAKVRIWKKKSSNSGKADLLRLSFTNHTKETLKWHNGWKDSKPGMAVYIPVKEMLANAPHFLSLYEKYELHFEAVYADIIHYANLPPLRGTPRQKMARLSKKLDKTIDGRVIQKQETFYLKSKRGELEFTLLAEGMRKLGLLSLLINNGALSKGSYLFWDEPETNLNPVLQEPIVEILLELQRMGVQIFLATHDYVFLKEFDLQATKKDKIFFHSLYHDNKTKEIEVSSTDQFLDISPNAIDDAFGNIVDRDIAKSMGGKNK
jgi:predicted ATP-dependent endonuclease of OLD family